MPMKNPPHPGRGIPDDLEVLGLSVAHAAKTMGVTRQQLYNVINGRSGITADMAVKLERLVGGTAETWLRMQGAYDLAQVRLREHKKRPKRSAARLPVAAE